MTSMPWLMASMVTALMTPLMPGAGPPPTTERQFAAGGGIRHRRSRVAPESWARPVRNISGAGRFFKYEAGSGGLAKPAGDSAFGGGGGAKELHAAGTVHRSEFGLQLLHQPGEMAELGRALVVAEQVILPGSQRRQAFKQPGRQFGKPGVGRDGDQEDCTVQARFRLHRRVVSTDGRVFVCAPGAVGTTTDPTHRRWP